MNNGDYETKPLIKINVFLLIVTCLLLGSYANAAGVGNTIVVRLVGTGSAYGGDSLFESFDLAPLDALCFNVDLSGCQDG